MPEKEILSLQKLFAVTIVLKILSSYLGWLRGDPWILGLAIPVGIMTVYVFLGLRRKDRAVSDEKFADSCYYLGFIFTITSIIFCLFDIPNIGAKLTDIALRFGTAMVTTVIGLIVRVILINFKQDAQDAKEAAEQGVIEASNRLREQLVIALEKLQSFESQVDSAARNTVERVNLQIEGISKSYGKQLEAFFDELSEENKEATHQALNEVKEANSRLASIVDNYSKTVNGNLKTVEQMMIAFTDAVVSRLKATTFPDDYFAKNLAAPVGKLREGTEAVSAGILDVAEEVKNATSMLAAALKSLRTKATQIEGNLGKISQVTSAQGQIFEKADSQLATFSEFSYVIHGLNTTLANIAEKIDRQSNSITSLIEKAEPLLQRASEGDKQLTATNHAGTDIPTILPASVSRKLNPIDGIQLAAELPLASTSVIIPAYSNFRFRSEPNGDSGKKPESGAERNIG